MATPFQAFVVDTSGLFRFGVPFNIKVSCFD